MQRCARHLSFQGFMSKPAGFRRTILSPRVHFESHPGRNIYIILYSSASALFRTGSARFRTFYDKRKRTITTAIMPVYYFFHPDPWSDFLSHHVIYIHKKNYTAYPHTHVPSFFNICAGGLTGHRPGYFGSSPFSFSPASWRSICSISSISLCRHYQPAGIKGRSRPRRLSLLCSRQLSDLRLLRSSFYLYVRSPFS